MTKKHHISKANYQMLFDYLAKFLNVEYQDFYPHLMKALVGYWCKGEEQLHEEREICKKTWFITKGMVYLCFLDKNKGDVVFMLFGAKEIAIIPDSFMNGNPSTCDIMACAGTELLEITRSKTELIHRVFPKTLELENSILAKIPEKVREREELLCFEPELRIVKFFELRPELHPYSKSVKMLDKTVANYLRIDKFHYCKFKNTLYPKKLKKVGVRQL